MHALILLSAGVLAGLVGAAGGITSLISYPALLAVGLPAFTANVANNVAIVTLCPGAALASRPELRGRSPWLRRWLPFAAAGGGVGAALLLLTPPGVFADVVPFLVLSGSVALIAQPRLTAWYQRRHAETRTEPALAIGMLLVCVYSGYFGAGAGVMLLSLLLLAERHLPVANALKNMLLGATSICTALVFVAFGSIDWGAAVPLGIGVFIGSRLGPEVTRRVPPDLMRVLIALVGLGLAVELWLNRAT